MRAFTLFALLPVALATTALVPRQQVPQAPAGITPTKPAASKHATRVLYSLISPRLRVAVAQLTREYSVLRRVVRVVDHRMSLGWEFRPACASRTIGARSEHATRSAWTQRLPKSGPTRLTLSAVRMEDASLCIRISYAYYIASVNGGSGGTGTAAAAPTTTDDTGKGAASMLSAHGSLVVRFVALSFAGVAML